MTIPLTNVNMQHINAAMNRTPTARVDFDIQVNRLMPASTEPISNVSIADTCGRVKNNGYVALIKADGVNGSTAISDITDTFRLSTIGTGYVSTAQSKFGGASLYTDNTNVEFYLVNNPINTDLTAYSGDWTIEVFVYYITGSGISRFVTSFGGAMDSSIRFDYTRLHAYYFEPPSNTFRSIYYELYSRPTNVWFHCAFVKHGTSLYLYYNGNKVGTSTCASNAMPMRQIRMGNSGVESFTGYLDELRFSNFARYTAATYTVPTASYDV